MIPINLWVYVVGIWFSLPQVIVRGDERRLK